MQVFKCPQDCADRFTALLAQLVVGQLQRLDLAFAHSFDDDLRAFVCYLVRAQIQNAHDGVGL